MNLIPIPSENCPHCRKKKGQCSMVISEVGTLIGHSMKINERELRAQFEGRSGPAYREAYVVQQYICLEGKGIS